MKMEERYNSEHSSVDESADVQMDCLEQSLAPWIGRTIKTVSKPGKIVRSHDSDGKEIWELPGSDDFYEMVTEYHKESIKLKVYQRGECDEYDAKERMIPFKGLLLCDFPSDREDD